MPRRIPTLSLLLSLVAALILATPAAAQLALYNSGQEEPANKEVNLQATMAAKRGELQLEVQERQQKIKAKREAAQAKVKQRKEQIFEKVKERFLNHLDRLIGHLQNIQKRISATSQLEESEKQKALANLDALISKLDTLKAQVEDAQSLEDIRSIRQNVLSAWQEVRAAHHRYIGLILKNRFHKRVAHLNRVADRLEEHLSVLSQQGVDVAMAKEGLDQFRSVIASAQASIKQAGTDFENGDFTSGQAVLATAKTKLHQAAISLRTTILSLKSQIEK